MNNYMNNKLPVRMMGQHDEVHLKPNEVHPTEDDVHPSNNGLRVDDEKKPTHRVNITKINPVKEPTHCLRNTHTQGVDKAENNGKTPDELTGSRIHYENRIENKTTEREQIHSENSEIHSQNRNLHNENDKNKKEKN